MPSLPYRPRIVQIITDEGIASAGEVIVEPLPSDFTVTGIVLTEKHVQVTDEATLAEKLASLTTFELTTRNGSPWKISGEDLYYFDRDFYGRHPHIAGNSVATDNLIIYKSLAVPLNPLGVWNPHMGVTPRTKGKVKITMGTDTASGSDARTLTVSCYGFEGAMPPEFLGMFTDNYSAVLGDNFRDLQSDRVTGMAGIYNYGATGIEDLTTTDAPSLKNIGWAVAKSVREKVRAHGTQLLSGAWNEVVSPGEAAGLPVSDYHLFDMGLKQGMYVPYVSDLQAYLETAVASDFRTLPMLMVRND